MKTALYLFSAGALVAQAKLRPEIVQDNQFSYWSDIGLPNDPTISDTSDAIHYSDDMTVAPAFAVGVTSTADNQFSFWSDIGSAFSSAASSIASGVTSAANSVASGVTSGTDTVGNGVTSAADNVASGVTSAADTVGNGVTSAANTVGNGVTSTATTVGDGVAQVAITAYQASASVVDQVADDFENGADWVAAEGNWAAATLGNAQTYIDAIQSTAQACSTYFNDLNALTGGQLTIQNLEMADEVLDMAFPEGAVVFDGVTVALELAVGTADITDNVNGIVNGIQTNNYMEVVQNSFQLFQTITELAGSDDEDDEDDDAEDY